MIEILLSAERPPMIVGEKKDLEDIVLIVTDMKAGRIRGETLNGERRDFGGAGEDVLTGLAAHSAVIVTALKGNTMAFAREIDVNTYHSEPRLVSEVVVRGLADAIAETGFQATVTDPSANANRRKGTTQ